MTQRILTSVHLGTHIPKAKAVNGSLNSNKQTHFVFHIFPNKQKVQVKLKCGFLFFETEGQNNPK
jgi:hypothetical protein